MSCAAHNMRGFVFWHFVLLKMTGYSAGNGRLETVSENLALISLMEPKGRGPKEYGQ